MANGAFDYRHRPAKNIERHLIVDACRRLLMAYPGDYQYVGFGALEFIDFQLMHRALGIERMISIEKQDTTRHEFNKPFKTIKIIRGQSNDLLRRKEISLDQPSIVWLDYTSELKGQALDDVLQVARIIASPSMLFVTINAQPTTRVTERLSTYVSNVGPEYAAPWATDSSLAKHGLARAQRETLSAVMERGLKERKDVVTWHQIVNIHYRDGALMQTIGGAIAGAETSTKKIGEIFGDLAFYRPGEDEIDLRVPVITTKERALLDRQLPKKSPAQLRAVGIPPSELDAYRNVYKYLHLAGLQSAGESTWVT